MKKAHASSVSARQETKPKHPEWLLRELGRRLSSSTTREEDSKCNQQRDLRKSGEDVSNDGKKVVSLSDGARPAEDSKEGRRAARRRRRKKNESQWDV